MMNVCIHFNMWWYLIFCEYSTKAETLPNLAFLTFGIHFTAHRAVENFGEIYAILKDFVCADSIRGVLII